MIHNASFYYWRLNSCICKSTQASLASFVHHLSSAWSAPLSITTPLENLLSQAPPFASLLKTLNQPTYAQFQHLYSSECPLNVVKILLDPPSLINTPCLIYAPHDNYTKLLGISKKGENHSIHSVSCLIYWEFEYFHFHRVRTTMKTQ